MDESPIVAFYRGTGTDHAGRLLRDVLAWDNEALEQVHDYVQWVFPNALPSRANSAAPLLTPGDVATFRGDPALQQALRAALARMLAFYGLRRSGPDGMRIERGDDWPARSRQWLQPYNHNHLRLTRMMKCLQACGLDADARALQEVLLDIARRTDVGRVSRATAGHWERALE